LIPVNFLALRAEVLSPPQLSSPSLCPAVVSVIRWLGATVLEVGPPLSCLSSKSRQLLGLLRTYTGDRPDHLRRFWPDSDLGRRSLLRCTQPMTWYT